MMGSPVRRSWLGSIIRLVGSVILLAVLAKILPLDELWSAVQLVPAIVWFVVLAAFLATHFLGALKWHLFINAYEAGLPLRQSVRCYYTGLFGNLLLPSVIGGDVISAGMALRDSRNKAGILLGTLTSRLCDLLVLLFLAGLGMMILPHAIIPKGKLFIGVIVMAVIGVVVVLVATALLRASIVSFSLRRKLVRVRQALRSARRYPRTMFVGLLMSGSTQIAFLLLTAWLGYASDLNVTLRTWLFTWPLAKLSAFVPVSQGGIGAREVAFAVLMKPFDVEPFRVVAVSLVWETILVSGSLLAGGMSLVWVIMDRLSAHYRLGRSRG